MFEDTKRILVINVNWIGDVLLTTPTMRAIRERFPNAYISCLVVDWCKDILADNPHIDGLISYEKKGKHRSVLGKISLLRQIRKKHFDTVFVLHRSRTRALLAYLSGAKYRIGYNTKKRGCLLTAKIEPSRKKLHKLDYFLGILEPLSLDINKLDKELVLSVNTEDERFIFELLKTYNIDKKDFLVGLNPGANWSPKCWTVSGFAELADKLINKYNAKIVITGNKKDRILAKEIANKMQNEPLIMAGKTTLCQLAALIKRCNLFISADSGPMHMAAAIKTPLIALFGPTSSQETGPIGSGRYKIIQKKVDCQPCKVIKCKNNLCMKSITPADVLKETELLYKTLQ